MHNEKSKTPLECFVEVYVATILSITLLVLAHIIISKGANMSTKISFDNQKRIFDASLEINAKEISSEVNSIEK